MEIEAGTYFVGLLKKRISENNEDYIHIILSSISPFTLSRARTSTNGRTLPNDVITTR